MRKRFGSESNSGLDMQGRVYTTRPRGTTWKQLSTMYY